MSDPSRLKFFKVFVETQSKERLRIPVYLMHMEGQKPQVFCLSGSSGDAWQVNLVEVLEKDSDELYFTHGWATFVKDNLIEHGHLLLFQYAGELNIKVEIFSRSGCPKEAAFHARCSQSKNIPIRFARSYGLLQKHFVTLVDPSRGQWLGELGF
ncbi:hypothetical protein CDL15_Pgr003968 [Punica granatum]|uniref:TF-B3 domain-containing protein n=1 Tax=Punica granatum TaxID=22663 RepID=A0A218WNV7_PUNGR|nr:hypothetical protein CDL15_Pgr003968 [Punica granatum]PKI48668.1 hypothetical protein CRG98_030955 [Punica granatum]